MTLAEFNKKKRCIGCNEWTDEGVLMDTSDLGSNRCVCPRCAFRRNLKKADKNADNVLTLFFIVNPDELPEMRNAEGEEVEMPTSSRIYAAMRAKFHFRRHNGKPVAMSATHRMSGSEHIWTVSLSLAYQGTKRNDPRRPLHGLEEQGFTFTGASGYRVGKGNMITNGETLDETCDLWAKGFTYPSLEK